MDPLKPFSSLIRSVRDRQARRTPSEKSGAAPARSLHSRIRQRIRGTAPWDAVRARIGFVEAVLQFELGTQIANDPAFAEVVDKINLQLTSDRALSARLDDLLQQLAQEGERCLRLQ